MAAKKNWAKAKVRGERCAVTLDGPLMPVIEQMFVSVPLDNQEYLISRIQAIHLDMKESAK